MRTNSRLSLVYSGEGNRGRYSLTRLNPEMNDDNLYDLATAINSVVDRGDVTTDFVVTERFLLI